MAVRKEEYPLTRHNVFLYEGDFAKLRSIAGRMGAAKIIRKLVREEINRRIKPLPKLNI